MSRTAAIIVAAGSSSRLPGEVPKVYRSLNGRMVLEHSLAIFRAHPAISQVLVVANPEHEAHYRALQERESLWMVGGGQTRQESVYNGLDALADNPPDWVLVHDAARPFVSAEVVNRVLESLKDHPVVIPSIAVKDTIKQTDGNQVCTLHRASLCAVQTPQGFHYAELLAAHMAAERTDFTDDAAVAEAAGLPVTLAEGDEANRKLTTPEDLQYFNKRHSEHPEGVEESESPHASHDRDDTFRVGQGYDVHQLIDDASRPLIICGVDVPSDMALKGHSDADVGLHALVDALLGAMGKGDIGEHFPPSEDRWKNADSAAFVAEAMRLLKERGGRVINADITLIAEAPKLSPYKAAMRARIAELLDVAEDRVNIKATTTEGLGFTGRKEGIAAQAVLSIRV